ncbi:glycerate kinase [Halobacillus litoralis]|uniref:glycerate kinase n=1 Tax=Halobacillus litoralis TaxID=45668 RepID=UPI001CD697FD|nr:glycerate kinase [Halobacillus litoralis]MCA1021111.1 glycerate kinase [Halobacillus litoralis]
MKIIVAPDSFKGSMSSAEACEAVKQGLQAGSSTVDVQSIPMADGGEGTVEALMQMFDGELIEETVHDPLGRTMTASYGWIPEERMAVIETASASGLPLLNEAERNPLQASTYGTGELAEAAIEKGAETIILGLGGSATVDAGSGFFQALGVQYVDEDGNELHMNGRELGRVADVKTDAFKQRVKGVEWRIASDVSNPLLGREGAVTIFGPQKGADESCLAELEAGMTRYAAVIEQHTGRTVRDKHGSGAAGGFGFSLFSLLDEYHVESGFEMIAELGKLEEQIAGADLVITGEGKVDAQSLYGKGPIGLSRLAKKHQVPCVAFAGMMEGDLSEAENEGLLAVLPIVDKPMTLKDAVGQGPELLKHAARRFMDVYTLDQRNGERTK